MNRMRVLPIILLLCCVACLGQSRFNNQIEPGRSTRADVDRTLGQPLRIFQANQSEYRAPTGASRLVVVYRGGSDIVDLIQVDLNTPYARAAMLQSLHLPERADAAATRNGHLVEYFGGNSLLALAYATADSGSGVTILGYYSREMFERVIAGVAAGAAPPVANRPTLIGSSNPVAVAAAPDTDLRIKLLTPINTQTSRKGDKITAQVIEPATYNGDILEGIVRESKSGGKVTGKSVLNFSFTTLHHAGQPLPVQANVKSVANSKGQPEVDEEGQIIRKKNNLGKIAAGTAIGAVLGGLAGGERGALIGAGVGAAASIVLVEVAAEGANVSFAPGSEFVVSVKPQRNRQPVE